jgi:hypothetical protein
MEASASDWFEATMMILGIDTSCDDTSAGVMMDGGRVLSSVVHSQVQLHHPYGGVVPELASREHLGKINTVVQQALDTAGITRKDLDGIAVTVGPGLIGSLLVGLYFAKAFSYVLRIPYVGINHLEGHILSVFLEERTPSFPFWFSRFQAVTPPFTTWKASVVTPLWGKPWTMRQAKLLTRSPRSLAWGIPAGW